MNSTNCTNFSLLRLNDIYCLDEDFFITNNCISTKLQLAQYLILIGAMLSFFTSYSIVIFQRLRHDPTYAWSKSFLLLLAQTSSAFFFLIAYIILLANIYPWLSIIFLSLGLHCAIIWVDLVVYSMYLKQYSFDL